MEEDRNKTYHLLFNLLPYYLAKHKIKSELYNIITFILAMLARWHLFRELLIVCFLPDTDIVMTLVQYFVCRITHSFQL